MVHDLLSSSQDVNKIVADQQRVDIERTQACSARGFAYFRRFDFSPGDRSQTGRVAHLPDYSWNSLRNCAEIDAMLLIVFEQWRPHRIRADVDLKDTRKSTFQYSMNF